MINCDELWVQIEIKIVEQDENRGKSEKSFNLCGEAEKLWRSMTK